MAHYALFLPLIYDSQEENSRNCLESLSSERTDELL
jgi:hypothetical protein